jgi:drug/metabolite transporter (DMT)-like permease
MGEAGAEMMQGRQKAVVFLLCTAVLWSTGGLLVKWVEWHPMAIAGMRSAIAATFLLLVLRRPQFTWSGVQMSGGVAYAVSVLGFVVATRLTTAANAILLVYTAPIYVAVLSAWFLQERVTALDWLTILLVLGGMGLFFFERLSVEGFWGNICAIVGGMAFAWVVLCLRKQQGTSLLETVLLGNIIAALLGMPFMFRALPDLSSWVALLLSGTLQIGLAFVLYAIAIRSLSALEAILIPVIEPLLNPLWVFLLLGEVPSLWAVIGGSIVVVSVTVRGLIRFSRGRTASETEEMCYNQQPNVLS